MKHGLCFVTMAVGVVLGLENARAGSPQLVSDSRDDLKTASLYQQGAMEFQVLAGPIFSFSFDRDDTRPEINDARAAMRLGTMLSEPGGSGMLRGNFEGLIELSGGPVFHGPGDVIAGAALQLRYNFIDHPGDRVVPYFQIGAGGVYNDIYRDETQILVGAEIQFQLQAGLGIRWLLDERCALTVEAAYRHISNAGLNERNAGLDSLGGLVGFSWFF